MPVRGVSPASSDQWKVNSLHFLFHSAVLIFLQLLLPFSLRLVSFNPWDWSDCHRLDKLTSAWWGSRVLFSFFLSGILTQTQARYIEHCIEKQVHFYLGTEPLWKYTIQRGKSKGCRDGSTAGISRSHGKLCFLQLMPHLLRTLVFHKVKQVACGERHTLFALEDGKVAACG